MTPTFSSVFFKDIAVLSGTKPRSSIASLTRSYVACDIFFSFHFSLIIADITCLEVSVFGLVQKSSNTLPSS